MKGTQESQRDFYVVTLKGGKRLVVTPLPYERETMTPLAAAAFAERVTGMEAISVG